MAMRISYWDNNETPSVLNEKIFFQSTLIEHQVFDQATIEDAKYLFFSLPSVIIVKGYALGFMHDSVKSMITQYIDQNKQELRNKANLKIQFRM
jgi:hypothetical protein